MRSAAPSPTHRQGSALRWLGLALVGWLSLFGASMLVAQTPPTDLKLVGDHWTAWDPPAVIEEGAEVYIIVRGDTLWDLAERFYGDPYLWPQIWERNQYILDAHWIYPGDPLVLGMQVETAEDVLGEPGEGAGGQDSGMFGSNRSAYVQLGTPDDIYCSGYIGELQEEFGYHVTGSEYEVLGASFKPDSAGLLRAEFGARGAIKVGLDTSDIVYVDGGRAAGLAPGDVLVAVEAGDRIRHPLTGKTVGRFYGYMGRVRVLSVQDTTAIAEVSQSCTPFTVGASLRPFVEEPIPSERKTPLRPVNEPHSPDRVREAPVILYSKDGLITNGRDSVVFVALGEADDVIPGDQFTIYRENKGDQPPVVLGELAILSVHELSSVAKITESRYPVYPGDRIVPK